VSVARQRGGLQSQQLAVPERPERATLLAQVVARDDDVQHLHPHHVNHAHQPAHRHLQVIIHTPVFMFLRFMALCPGLPWWLGGQVVSVLDSGAEGPGFKLQPRRCRVNCSHPLCLCTPSSKICSSPLEGCGGNCSLAVSNGSLPPG